MEWQFQPVCHFGVHILAKRSYFRQMSFHLCPMISYGTPAQRPTICNVRLAYIHKYTYIDLLEISRCWLDAFNTYCSTNLISCICRASTLYRTHNQCQFWRYACNVIAQQQLLTSVDMEIQWKKETASCINLYIVYS